MSAVIENVKAAFKQRLDESDWLDDETKGKSKEKVDAITKMVAYPDQVFNDTYLNEFYSAVSCMESCAVLNCHMNLALSQMYSR